MGILDKIAEVSPRLASDLSDMGKDLKKAAEDSGLIEDFEELKSNSKKGLADFKESYADAKKEYNKEIQAWKANPKEKLDQAKQEQRRRQGIKVLKLVSSSPEINRYNSWNIYDDTDELIYTAQHSFYDYMENGFSLESVDQRIEVHEDIRGVLQNKRCIVINGEDVSFVQKHGGRYSILEGEWTVAGSDIYHLGKKVATISKVPSLGETSTRVTYNANEDPLWLLIMTMLRKAK